MSLTKFTKAHGLGNDFIVFEDIENRLALSEATIRRLCDRRFGIGADGIIIIKDSPIADCFMDYRNADGSIAQMCGNGVRVSAKYFYDHLRQKSELLVETPAGVKVIRVKVDSHVEQVFEVEMGEPVFAAAKIPMLINSSEFINQELDVNGRVYRATGLSMGNPHCVVFVENAAAAAVEIDGPAIESHVIFPEKTNVEFVQIAAPDHLVVRVWERGVGETPACGTGACAALVAAGINQKSGKTAIVELPGGVLKVSWLNDNRVIMEGPAEEVFTGAIEIEG